MSLPLAELIALSPALREPADLIVRVAPTEASVLILGETGTGKELLAQGLHSHSGRPGRFVGVDCGALPDQLVESLLFGHARGAFTGAVGKGEGLIRSADRGTLFLDEIGNLPPPAQLSLLRVLQERRVRPVGSAEELPVSARIVAATSEDLGEAVREGRFREDLFYRLDVIRIVVPPLRERGNDVVLLFEHFLRQLSERHAVQPLEVSPSLHSALREYHWPGNVRQLENLVERLVLTGSERGILTGDDLDLLVWPRRLTNDASGASLQLGTTPLAMARPARTLEEAVDVAERAYLERLLEDHEGRMEDAAVAGGVSRRTLQRKLRKHGLDRRDFASEASGESLWISCPPFTPLRLGPGPRIVGRDPGCDLCLPHSLVSRHHLRLRWEEDQVWAEDAGSTNGTVLNGRPLLEPTRIAPGDLIEVGAFELSVVQGDGTAETEEEEDTHCQIGSGTSRLEIAEGSINTLVAELTAAREPAVVQFELPEQGPAGILIDGGRVVRAYYEGLEGEPALQALMLLSAGTCIVSRFVSEEGPGQGPATSRKGQG